MLVSVSPGPISRKIDEPWSVACTIEAQNRTGSTYDAANTSL